MKSIIIARVSTEEQKNKDNSIPAQIERLKRYCKNKDFEIIKEFSFDESAYKEKRDDFDNILDFVLEQKDQVAICFDKVDRLSRNIFDIRVSKLYERALKDEVILHFVSDGQIISSNLSAVEKFNFSISLGLAKYYSDAISDNVKRAIEGKLRKGEFPGKAPYGYINIRISEDKTDIVIDEFPAMVVRKAYELYASKAYSMDLLRAKLLKDYGVKFSKGFIDNILKNPFYYGEMLLKDKTYPHRYEPLVTRVLYEQVQQIKAGFNKKRFKYAGKPYFYRGLLRCGHCGLAMTPEKHKGHIYYHCTEYNGKHGAKWLREDSITEQIGNVFKNIQMPDGIIEQILSNLNEVHKGKMDFQNLQFEKLNKERKETTSMIVNLYMDKLKGSITNDDYDRFYERFREKISDIDTRLAMLQDAEDNYYITAKYLLDLSKRAYELFVGSEAEERRQLINLVLSNLRVDGKEVHYDAVKPFDSILVSANSNLWLECWAEYRQTDWVTYLEFPEHEAKEINRFLSGGFAN